MTRRSRGDALLLSDLHLGAGRAPERRLEAFERFCAEHAARGFGAVYCLGDLFHHWVGPGHEDRPLAARALRALGRFVAAGAELVLVHGNRDFLLGPEALERTGGGRIVPDAIEVEHHGIGLRLEHGDLLCARDTRYRAMRRLIRARWARRCFLALPLERRLRWAGGMRRMSAREIERKSGRTLALSPAACRARLRRSPQAAALVIGHVHRACVRRLAADGRWVISLGAWEGETMSWIELRREALVLFGGAGGRARLRLEAAALRRAGAVRRTAVIDSRS